MSPKVVINNKNYVPEKKSGKKTKGGKNLSNYKPKNDLAV
jgi:hypothetical protein